MKKIICLFFTLLALPGVIPRASAQYYGVGVNVAALMCGTVNASFELSVAPRWSLDIPLYWNPINTHKVQMQLLAVQPGVRFWFFEEYAGHFIGAHLAAAKYDIGGRSFHRAGWLAGAGLSYGYCWLLTSRWNLTVEAGVGLYYTQDRKRDHGVSDLQPEWIDHNRRLMLLPSKCTLGFTYLF